MKLTIKLPTNEKGKFKLQSKGNIEGRQFKTAAGLLGSLGRALLRLKTEEKLAIAIKECIDSHFININESLASNNREYLIYTATCFLEDYLSIKVLKKAEKKWTKHLMAGGDEL